MTYRTIRRARLDEAPLLSALQDRSSQHWGYPDDFFDWVGGDGIGIPPGYIEHNQVFVLEEDGRITGFHGLTREGDEVVLDRLFVDLDRIGTGCGKLLWRHAVNTARAMGATSLVIGADPNAASFYAKMGAVWTGEKQTGNPDWVVQMYRYDVMPWTVRAARLDDADALHALTQRSSLHWGYEPEFLDWEPEAIAVTPEFLSEATAYVLAEGETIVGYYALVQREEGPRLDKLFVDEGWIGTGAGKRLWCHMIETARGMEGDRLDFFADPNAAPFYRAMGATWVREVETSRPGWNLQYFTLDLASARSAR